MGHDYLKIKKFIMRKFFKINFIKAFEHKMEKKFRISN